MEQPNNTNKRRRRGKRSAPPTRIRSDERKLHPLEMLSFAKNSTKPSSIHSSTNKTFISPRGNAIAGTESKTGSGMGIGTDMQQHQQQQPEQEKEIRAKKIAVKPVSRSLTRHARLQRLSEEQLELLDHQVNRQVKEKAQSIYEALVRRFYPKKRENRVLTHDAAAHRVHAAFRFAVSELIDVRAIQEKILSQLEGMIGQRDDHSGFGFLLHVGKNKNQDSEEGPAKPQTLKEKIHAKKRQIHEQQVEADRQANMGNVEWNGRSLRGAAFWRHIVRQKHWKALKPKIDRIKPWDIPKYVEFPKHEIDIRSWKDEKGTRRRKFEDGRMEWMEEQFRVLNLEKEHEGSDENNREGNEDDSMLNVINENENEEEEDENDTEATDVHVNFGEIPAQPSPAVTAFGHMLTQHTTRKDTANLVPPEMASKRFDTWEEIVSMLQKQGVVSRNYHRLWDNDQRRWPVRPTRPRISAVDEAKESIKNDTKENDNTESKETTKDDAILEKEQEKEHKEEKENTTNPTTTTAESNNKNKDTSTKQWPDRLGRYLLPNYDLVHPSSKGTLEDYYASLSKNAPEKALVGLESEKIDKVQLVIPPWFRVLAGKNDSIEERSQLHTNWLRCEISAVPTRPSTHVPRLGGIFSARPTPALPCSSFAPHMWNHSSSTKDSREKWKHEHGKVIEEDKDNVDLDSKTNEKDHQDPKNMHSNKNSNQKQQFKNNTQNQRNADDTALQSQLANLVERDETKTMRWTKFLPEGASYLKQKNNDIDHDLVIRKLICKTTFLSLHSIEHHEKNRLLEVRTGGEDDTVRQAVLSSNPLIYMNRTGRSSNYHDVSSSTSSTTVTPIVPKRIPPFPYRVVHRLLKHLKEYVEMGPERLKMPFCPMELSRVLTAVFRATIKQHKELKEASKGKLG